MRRRSASSGPLSGSAACSSAAGIAVMVGCFLAFVLNAPAEEGAGDSLQFGKVKELFERYRGAVVRVESSDRHGTLSGTGFFVYGDEPGTIYTLSSVIGDGTSVTVSQGLRKLPATVLLKDSRSGIAMVKVEAPTPFFPIGDSSRVQTAAPVMAIGYPLDLPVAPSFGIVAGLDKKFLGYYFMTTHIRANLPVQRGFGGAPVLDMRGEVIGIVVSGIDGGAGCYVLPINAAEKVRAEYLRFGRTNPGWVGVEVEEASDANGPSTARVAELLPETPASLSGLRQGDLILQIGDVRIASPEDVLDASFFLTADDTISIRVLREGQELSFLVRAAQHPLSRHQNLAGDLLGIPGDLKRAFDLRRN